MNMNLFPRLLDAGIRNDPMVFLWKVFQTVDPATEFKPNWHYETFFVIAQKLIDKERWRGAICAPPRTGKSMFVMVALVAWILGHDPTRKIVCISYNSEMAAKFANDFRRVVRSDWYRRAFPHTVVADWKDTEVETHFTAGGFRLGTSIGGMVTGRGGDHVLFDDPIKAQDAHYDNRRESVNRAMRNTIVSRLDDLHKGAILGAMQRLHSLDFVGCLPPDYDVHNFPAVAPEDRKMPLLNGKFHLWRAGESLHPERLPLHELTQMRETMGPDEYAAQFLQQPIPPGGFIIKKPWIRFYDEVPSDGYYLLSWDTAGKTGPRNSYSVCTAWFRSGSVNYLVDLIRGRFDYPTLRDTAIELAERYDPRVILVEDASTGVALEADIREAGPFRVELVPVVGDKVNRLFAVTGKFASGNVLFPPMDKAFMPELLHELLRFPQSAFTDQVDSISQALSYTVSGYSMDYIT